MGFCPPLEKCANRTNRECFRGNHADNMPTIIIALCRQKGLICRHCPMSFYETLIEQG